MTEIWHTRPTTEGVNKSHIGTACEHLEIECIEVGDDYIRARMPTTERTRQPYGTIHGGVSLVLAETLASVKNVTVEELAEATTENFLRYFDKVPPAAIGRPAAA